MTSWKFLLSFCRKGLEVAVGLPHVLPRCLVSVPLNTMCFCRNLPADKLMLGSEHILMSAIRIIFPPEKALLWEGGYFLVTRRREGGQLRACKLFSFCSLLLLRRKK